MRGLAPWLRAANAGMLCLLLAPVVLRPAFAPLLLPPAVALALALLGDWRPANHGLRGGAIAANALCTLASAVLLVYLGFALVDAGVTAARKLQVGGAFAAIFALSLCNVRALVGPDPRRGALR